MAKPAVDGFERSHKDQVIVIRLGIRSSLGNQLAYQFNARAVPTFLMFDRSGNLAGRHVGVATSASLNNLLAQALEE